MEYHRRSFLGGYTSSTSQRDGDMRHRQSPLERYAGIVSGISGVSSVSAIMGSGISGMRSGLSGTRSLFTGSMESGIGSGITGSTESGILTSVPRRRSRLPDDTELIRQGNTRFYNANGNSGGLSNFIVNSESFSNTNGNSGGLSNTNDRGSSTSMSSSAVELPGSRLPSMVGENVSGVRASVNSLFSPVRNTSSVISSGNIHIDNLNRKAIWRHSHRNSSSGNFNDSIESTSDETSSSNNLSINTLQRSSTNYPPVDSPASSSIGTTSVPKFELNSSDSSSLSPDSLPGTSGQSQAVESILNIPESNSSLSKFIINFHEHRIRSKPGGSAPNKPDVSQADQNLSESGPDLVLPESSRTDDNHSDLRRLTSNRPTNSHASNPSDPIHSETSITNVNRPSTSGSSRHVSNPTDANNFEADITDVNCASTSGSSSHASNPNHSETSIPDVNSPRTSDIRTDSEESDQFNLWNHISSSSDDYFDSVLFGHVPTYDIAPYVPSFGIEPSPEKD